MRAALAIAVTLATGCVFAPVHVDLAYRPLPSVGSAPIESRPSLAVVVKDRRPTSDSRNLGQRAPFFLVQPDLIAKTDPQAAVGSALVSELQRRGVRVTGLLDSEIFLRVEIRHFFCRLRDGLHTPMQRSTIRALLEADVSVISTRTREELFQLPLSASGRVHTFPFLLHKHSYDVAFNDALGRFARRVALHPGLRARIVRGARAGEM